MLTIDSRNQRDWFLGKCNQYSDALYFARTPTGLSGGPRPDQVTHIFSAVVRGTRYWCFSAERHLNEFLTQPQSVAMTKQQMMEHISL